MKKDKRTNRVFRSERRDIQFPMWRKKVDRSLFQEKGFTVANFARNWWNLDEYFPGLSNSKKDPRSKMVIEFKKEQFRGNITYQKSRNTFRVFFDEKLADLLKETFLMTFMRDLEHKLGDYDQNSDDRISIEEVIPFSEFLDIEFDPERKVFIFTAHYRQKPTFPHLFSKILNTTVLKSIELENEEKSKPRVLPSNWRKRSELLNVPDQPNVIYMLFDEKNKEFYVGEARSLHNRLTQERTEIPNWTHFRYNVLPPELEPFRVQIERMVIRDFAAILANSKKSLKTMKISECIMKNKKIDL